MTHAGLARATTSGGEFTDYVDARRRGRGGARRHPPHAGHPGARPGLPVELQGRQVRLVLGRDQRPAPPHVHDADGHAPRGRGGDGGADADLPDHPRPGHRRLVQLRDGQDGSRRSRPDPRARGRLPDAAGRRRARPGVPQVHRVLPVPGRLPRHPRPRGEQDRIRRARGSSSASPSSRCTRSTPTTGASWPRTSRPRLLQHHQVLHRGVPRAHQDHRQRASSR